LPQPGQPERINAVNALRLLMCLALAACADFETKPWFKMDGSQASAEQLEFDKTACREEMQKSVRATNQAAALDRNVVKMDVYDGCMARLGYSEKNRGFSAPPSAQGGVPPPTAQGGLPPPGAQGAVAPPGVASVPPPSIDQDCRRPSDLRMWLPLCP
jgi:hypothetical protein